MTPKALALLLAGSLLAACGREPEPPPKTVVRPSVTPVPPPPKPPTLEEKIRKAREAEKTDPKKYRTLHETWSALVVEAKGTRHEAAIGEKLELLEGAANKAYRELFRPLQTEVRQSVADRRPREARDRLTAWKVPFELDIRDLLSADRARELGTLTELVDLEERRSRLHAAVYDGNLGRDPAVELKPFAVSTRVAVRAEADRSILELRRLRAADQRRRWIAAAPKEGRAAFGERPGAPVATEKRFEGKIPPPVREALDAARALVPRLRLAANLAEFESLATQGTAHAARAVAAAPWLPVGYYYRAEWRYTGRGDTLGALTDLDEAIQRQPPFVEAHLARAALLVELDLADPAGKALGFLSRALPEPVRSPLARAREHAAAKRKGEARAELDRAFRALPDDLSFLQADTREMPDEPGWAAKAAAHETDRYVLKAERAPAARLKSWGDALEAGLAWFPSILRTDAKPAPKVRVFVFGNEDGYSEFVPQSPERMLQRSGGTFHSVGRRIFLYEQGDMGRMREVLLHEAWHAHSDGARGTIPTWLDEGLAEYAGSAVIRDGRVADVPPNRDNLVFLETAFGEGWAGLPFAEIMGASQQEFYGTLRSLQYAQAWSMVHFFRHGEKGRHAPAFQAYLSLAAGGAPCSRAFAESFGKEDLPRLQDEWRAFVRGLPR